jgi:CDP-6-deoxy-D-xylo-4-hexulose-3-dehydrase
MKIPLVKSTFYKEQETKEALTKFIMDAKKLSMGDEVAKFERNFADWQGRKYAAMVNSGSSANLILIQAMLNTGRLRKGDKVGVSALTWATNVMPLIQLGLEPRMLSVDSHTLNLSDDIALPTDLDAVFVTNALGFSCDLDILKDKCDALGIPLLEDNCEALGSNFGVGRLGNFGIASTFSFFVGHHLSTIEGGMVCTDDKSLYEALVMARAHGWKRDLEGCPQDGFYDKYKFYQLGYNVRPTEIQGFLGNYQLQFLDETTSIRWHQMHKIFKAVRENPDILDWGTDGNSFCPLMAFPLVFKTHEKFKTAMDRFWRAEVEIRPIISGNILEQPFIHKYNFMICAFPEELQHNSFYFPNNPELTEEELNLLVKLVKGES